MANIDITIIDQMEQIFRNIQFEEPSIPLLGDEFLTPIKKIKTELRNHINRLKICHINAVSVPKHRDEIGRIINETAMDIIAISETNIKKDTPKERYKLDGYKLFRTDRKDRKSGGVGIYINENIRAKRIQVKYDNQQPEMCFIEAEVNSNKILVGVIYKSPSEKYSIFGEISEILQYFNSKYRHMILLGDFNIDQLKTEKPAYKFFQNMLIVPMSLTQIVNEPTRITENSSTLIDLILVNNVDSVKAHGVVDLPGISDHSMVYLAYALKKPKCVPKRIRRRDFRNFDEVEFHKDLEKCAWGNIYSIEESDVDNQVTILENIFSEVINKHAPYREIKVRKPVKTTWMTDEVIKLMDNRDKYKSKYNKYKDTHDLENYKNLKNKVNYMIRKAKTAEINDTINSKTNDSKKFHKALKDKHIVDSKHANKAGCNINPEDLNSNFLLTNNTIIDYNSIRTEINKIKKTSRPPTFEFRESTEKEIKKAVKSLKTKIV